MTTATTVKSVIENASQSLKATVDRTESAARATAEKIETAVGQARANYDQVQELAMNALEVAGAAGRTGWKGVQEINGAVAAHGRDLVTDMIETGRKSFAVRSFGELVQLHTEYAARRINAGFEFAGKVNTLAHQNTLAAMQPVVSTLAGSAEVLDEQVKPAKARKPAKGQRAA
jgi:hypothetical protein